jgi:hypothetical protein
MIGTYVGLLEKEGICCEWILGWGCYILPHHLKIVENTLLSPF